MTHTFTHLCAAIAFSPGNQDSLGTAHRHDTLLGAGDGVDADLRVDVENGSGGAALGPRLGADTRKHGVVVLVGGDEVLLEDDLLAAVAREGVAGAAGTGLAGREGGITDEAGLDDGHAI